MMQRMFRSLSCACEYAVAVGIVFVVGVVVVGACAALLPIRWIIEWDVLRQSRKTPNSRIA